MHLMHGMRRCRADGLVISRSVTKVSPMKTELVTALKRNASTIISPAVTFDALHEDLAVLEAIRRGERAIQDQRVASHRLAKRRMARWLR
jgi:hypothetical protein